MPSHPLGQWQPCPTCCVVGCVYASDNMDHANSTTLDAMWTETAGDWFYDTNRLKIAASTNVARVFVNDSGQFAELERITATCGRLRLYDGSTCKGSIGISLSTWTRVVICIEADKIHAGVGGGYYLTIPATATSDVVALGTGDGSKVTCGTANPTGSKKLLVSVTISFDGSGNIFFEDFSLSKHADDDATCPACGNEGCTWFRDDGCASGSLSATDYTTTGTWVYASGLKCTADGAVTVVPTPPEGPTGYRFSLALPKEKNYAIPDGAVLSLKADGGAVELRLTMHATAWHYWDVQLFVSATQHGPTVHLDAYYPKTIALCVDATEVSAYATGTDASHTIDNSNTAFGTFASASHTATSGEVSIGMTGLSGGAALYLEHILGVRLTTDEAVECVTCTPACGCEVDTEIKTAQITIAGLVAFSYGCACSDITAVLNRGHYSSWGHPVPDNCGWFAYSLMCGLYNYFIMSYIEPAAGGWKLVVRVMLGLVVVAQYEITVIGTTIPCNSAFNGSITLVSGSATAPCDFSASTCDFQAT